MCTIRVNDLGNRTKTLNSTVERVGSAMAGAGGSSNQIAFVRERERSVRLTRTTHRPCRVVALANKLAVIKEGNEEEELANRQSANEFAHWK